MKVRETKKRHIRNYLFLIFEEKQKKLEKRSTLFLLLFF